VRVDGPRDPVRIRRRLRALAPERRKNASRCSKNTLTLCRQPRIVRLMVPRPCPRPLGARRRSSPQRRREIAAFELAASDAEQALEKVKRFRDPWGRFVRLSARSCKRAPASCGRLTIQSSGPRPAGR